GARSKSRQVRTVPASDQLIRLYGDYVHQEFGDLDSDYVLSRNPDNTYCPDLAVMPAAHGKRSCAREFPLAEPA
ncbi:MAG TPA: hypothetical protein VK162_08635, partial [Streptosporangiaceae bacterium]|nr:hypothetical protein [Streptosporangiaceae bacterium]